MPNLPDIFGCMVFNDKVMKERLPKDTYKQLKSKIKNSEALDINIANSVAHAMKEWAIEKGVTHFTHWFQPMTGITAEKHDSFITPTKDGEVIMEFSGKELIKGEPDASSFPSGGLRATFEARGYTAWDPTSYAFIKHNTLCIPTAFCSYGGESLDKKTPLLKSMEALNKQALRVLRLLGNNDVESVSTTVGAEQEYFLIDSDLYEKRKDLIFCGRTLFGTKPPKGQELEDHYFGTIKPRVSEFMKDLDEELWKLGISAKTEHNEVAPSQHELAPVFTTTNIACDNNQVIMEMMKIVAKKHNLRCLLHEKPFAGVNGSGKHNNWSISTNDGKNLLEPGKSPKDNLQFLLFLSAVIKAVDEYQDLLRISVASAGNDHRLGANEAPPAIVSVFLGDELTEILEAIEDNSDYDGNEKVLMETGVDFLPNFVKDTTDRNRTSPFAFTGNKFEFRMLGSALSIACPNLMLNTMVAEELKQFADFLEGSKDLKKDILKLIRKTMKEHKRIIFNGNNYSEEWVKEAENRGLLNLRTMPDAMVHYIDDKNVKLFKNHGVFTESEMRSRYEIQLENYSKVIKIEALTMSQMIKRNIIPAVSKYIKEIAQTLSLKKSLGLNLDCSLEESLLKRLSELNSSLYSGVNVFDEQIRNSEKIDESEFEKCAFYYKDVIIDKMNSLRKIIDELESIVDSNIWPYPTYSDMLFSV